MITNREWSSHQLKPIHMILKKYKNHQQRMLPSGLYSDRYDFPDQGWTINEDMARKFGDGEYYDFQRVEEEKNRFEGYTHKNHDGFYYNEKWFMDSLPIIELDEEDFLL